MDNKNFKTVRKVEFKKTNNGKHDLGNICKKEIPKNLKLVCCSCTKQSNSFYIIEVKGRSVFGRALLYLCEDCLKFLNDGITEILQEV